MNNDKNDFFLHSNEVNHISLIAIEIYAYLNKRLPSAE